MQVLELNTQDYDGSRHNIYEEKIDAAFRKVKPQSIGFYTWKVENGRVETVSSAEFGVFNDNETYIVYAAAPLDSFANAKTVCREAKPPNQTLTRFIHFWLGANTTAERSGAVAYKVIELDNQLGNTAVQFRESQGNESVRFRSYFKDGIIVLSQSQDQPIRLFEVRGKKCPTCVQRPVDWSSFSSESTMLFQTRKYVYVWLGRSSSSTERRNGLQLAEKIKEMYNVPEITTVDDGYEKSISELKKTDWNAHLSLNKRIVHPATMHRDGLLAVVRPIASFKLYRCGFTNAKYRIEEVKTGNLQQTDLNNAASAFIVDGGENRGVWIWLGRNSLAKDKAEAMRNARGFVKKKKYNAATTVVRVSDGSEPMEFKRIFTDWRSSSAHLAIATPSIKLSGQFDALTLTQRPKLAATTQLIDDGAGTLNIYKVPTASSSQLIEVPRRKMKALFSGDCFLIHYMLTSTQNNLQSGGRLPIFHEILYLWVGIACSPETAVRGEKLSTEMFERLRREGVMQVRVHEGWEPPHLLQIFKGKLIVFNGKSDDYDVTGGCNVYPVTFLLKVSGDVPFNSKAVQVTGKSAQFSSKDCLVMNNENEEVWVWCGQSSTGDKREIAKTIGTLVGEYSLALESSEPDAFWRCLPETIESKLRMAHTEPNGVAPLQAIDAVVELFVMCSMDSLGVTFQQINAFEQSDLTPNDVFLLDTGNCVFLWIGKQCLPTEQKGVWAAAANYLLDSWAARSKHTTIAVVHQGSEPVTFIGHFPDWNASIWENHMSFEVLRSQLDAASTTASHLTLRPNRNQTPEEAQFDRNPKYPLDVLRSESSELPEAVNQHRKEIHLTHDDFVAVFGMRFAEFETLPEWRKQQLKKAHKLF